MSYTQLTTAIEDHLENYESTFVDHIDDFIRQTEQEVFNQYQIPALRKNVTGTMTIGNRYMAVPSDFLAPFELSVLSVAGVYTNLLQKDVSWMREAYPDPATAAAPAYYALFDATTFVLSSTPDLAYTTELHYYYYPQSLVDAGGSNVTWLSTNFDIVLLYGCLVKGYGYMKGDADMMQFYDVKYKEALALLGTFGGRSMQDAYRQNPSRLRSSGQVKAPL